MSYDPNQPNQGYPQYPQYPQQPGPGAPGGYPPPGQPGGQYGQPGNPYGPANEPYPSYPPPPGQPGPSTVPPAGPYSAPPPGYGQPPYGQPPYGQPPYGQPPYGQPPYGQPPYGQQGYGQQQYGGPMPPPLGGASRWGPSSMGLEPNLAAGLGYLIPLLALIFFFMEKTNRFSRFHNAQAILLAIGGVIVAIVLGFANTAVSVGSYNDPTAAGLGLMGILVGCLSFLVYLAIGALFVWGIVAGFTGRYTKFPIIGDIAERWAGGPAVPAY